MNKTKLKTGALALGTLAAFAAVPSARAQSQDALLDKLVSKGVLTQDEAKDLREEADEGFKKSYQAKSGMPDWVTSMRFNGDFRGRFEGFYNGQVPDRTRYRYRLRFGFVASLLDDFEVGFRLGSGDATAAGGLIDPISTNQTLENNGAKKGIYIDLAYAKWNPINNGKWQIGVVAGKMENPFVTSDIVFDPDYTPEGASLNVKYNINDQHSVKLVAGGFILVEIGGSNLDPYMAAAQLRFDSVWDQNQKLTSTLGVGVFNIANDEKLAIASVPAINIGNQRNAGTTAPQYGINPIYADGAVTYNLDSFPMYPGKFPIKLAADYLHNPAAPIDRDGFSVGLTLGKSGKKKTWETTYRYRELQGNAQFEELVDSDSGAFYLDSSYGNSGLAGAGYRSGTNVRGHIIKASYSPFDTFTMGFTLFLMDAIHENPIGSGSAMTRLQVDAIWKF